MLLLVIIAMYVFLIQIWEEETEMLPTMYRGFRYRTGILFILN